MVGNPGSEPWCRGPKKILGQLKQTETVPCGRNGSGKLFTHGSSNRRRQLGSTFYGKISAYQPVIKRGWLENPELNGGFM
jgi:hypothetical protein